MEDENIKSLQEALSFSPDNVPLRLHLAELLLQNKMIAEAAEHWRLERLNVLDRLILRLAIYELLHEPDTPAKVVINEALELARTFSGDDAVRFVNGVLDAVRRKLERS